LHHPILILVRNPKRILSNHKREFDSLVRTCACGGHSIPSSSTSSSFEFVENIPDEPLIRFPLGYESPDVKTISYPSWVSLLETRLKLKNEFPRAFYASFAIREKLSTRHGLSLVAIADAYVVERKEMSLYEYCKVDWFFQMG